MNIQFIVDIDLFQLSFLLCILCINHGCFCHGLEVLISLVWRSKLHDLLHRKLFEGGAYLGSILILVLRLIGQLARQGLRYLLRSLTCFLVKLSSIASLSGTRLRLLDPSMLRSTLVLDPMTWELDSLLRKYLFVCRKKSFEWLWFPVLLLCMLFIDGAPFLVKCTLIILPWLGREDFAYASELICGGHNRSVPQVPKRFFSTLW